MDVGGIKLNRFISDFRPHCILVCPFVFPEISNKLDLKVASDQVIANSNTDFVIDRLGIQLLKEFTDEFITHLENKITYCEANNCEYIPRDLVTIDVPKKDFTLRPGAIPEIIDRIYYQALCNAIAPTIEDNLIPYKDKVLFSYRLNNESKKKNMFNDSRKAFNEFISYQDSICQEYVFEYVLETDIADYFQRIYHHDLFNLLLGFRCDQDIVNCISSLIRMWRKGYSYGIPQTMWPSYLLGNIYLHELDKFMIDKYIYVRYVDDIRVFCANKVKAKKALIDICRIIRPIGLSVQPAKTRIFDKETFCGKIKPFSRKISEFIENNILIVDVGLYFDEFVEIEVPVEELYISGLEEIFNSAINQNPKDEMAIKFCLSGFAFNRQPYAISFCLENLENLPHISSYFIKYFYSLGPDDNVAGNILQFLKSECNIYQWQEMWLLRYFFTMDGLNNEVRDYLKQVFLDKNKHIACRSIAVQLLGRNNDFIDLRFLKKKFEDSDSLWLKRAIIIAIKGLIKTERNQIYNYWKTQNWCQDLAIQYVKRHEGS